MKICVTGGAGYVGTKLVFRLLQEGHTVNVLDLFWFGDFLPEHEGLSKFKGDIREEKMLEGAFSGCDAVIHLACVSNDPSFDLNPKLAATINCDAFAGILRACRKFEVKHLIYASSSSVYGVSDAKKITEEAPTAPITDYSKFKLHCEELLKKEGIGSGAWTIVRPATICGFSPRMRFDLVLNLLTMQALKNRRITVFGGEQMRSHLHIRDMVNCYSWLLGQGEAVAGQTFNVSYSNMTVRHLAGRIRTLFNGEVEIEVKPTDDLRSYHVDSKKIREAGFVPAYSEVAAIGDLCEAWDMGIFGKDPLNDPRYFNIKRMKELNLESSI